MDYHAHVITVAETSEFAKRARNLLLEEERSELIFFLATSPKTGAVMEGTGGIRKLRWARGGKGKSGGVRIIYFFHNEGMPLYLLTLYGKNEKDDLSGRERKELAKLARILVQTAMKNKQR